MLLETIVQNILLNDGVSVNSINDAINGHNRVIINYKTNGKEEHNGARVIEVYAYGLTKAGNPVIRAFQPYGDTTTRVPSWKFFRVDRITAWKPTKQTFNEPPVSYYSQIGAFNENGDNSMSVVYKIAKFGDNKNEAPTVNQTGEKQQTNNQNALFKTDTERKMEKLRQQLQNPIKLSDIKTKNGFKQINTTKTPSQSGPKQTPQDSTQTNLQKTGKQNASNNQSMQQKNGTVQKQIGDEMTMTDFNNVLSGYRTDNKGGLYKTPTEVNMERLRQQLQNPRKIDLSKIPKR